MFVSNGSPDEIEICSGRSQWGRPADVPGGTVDTLDQTFPAVAMAARLARLAIAGYATAVGLHDELVHNLRLAVSEAVSNVIRHAYPDRPGTVDVAAGVVGDELWVLVADRGCGFRAPSRDPGLGLGLALIADASEDFVITERAGGGTEVRMHFGLSRARP